MSPRNTIRDWVRLLYYLSQNAISLIGVVLTTSSAVTLIARTLRAAGELPETFPAVDLQMPRVRKRQPLICTDGPRLHLVREQNDRPFSARMLPDGTAMHESRRAP
jgi:hypothetical protein